MIAFFQWWALPFHTVKCCIFSTVTPQATAHVGFLSCKLLDSNAQVFLHCSALFDFSLCSEMHLHLDLKVVNGVLVLFFLLGWVLVFNTYQVQSTPGPKKKEKRNVEWRSELGESKRGWCYYNYPDCTIQNVILVVDYQMPTLVGLQMLCWYLK